MGITVCLGTRSLGYLRGGAYMWVFLNWALGLRQLGCRVIWLDTLWLDRVSECARADYVRTDLGELQRRLEHYGLAENIAIIDPAGRTIPHGAHSFLDLEAAVESDLFVNIGYGFHADVVKRFRRSVFVDIDPGLTQSWMSKGQFEVPEHSLYFTYGETVGEPDSPIPDCGLQWFYTPPPVFLPAWPVKHTSAGAPYTTVSSWWGSNWTRIGGEWVENSKRSAFLNFLPLASRTSAQLELAVPLAPTEDAANDRQLCQRYGWNVRHVFEVSSTPEEYQAYVQQSRGEFSCMKRGYILLETAWTSERTLNYLASGKPAIVQHTGRSRFLPDAEGLFRFHSLDEAAEHLAAAEKGYERHSRAARALVEEYFDAEKVVAGVLERALA